MRILYLLGLLLVCPVVAQAQAFTYQLLPEQIAKNTWVVTGLTEDFSSTNGGDVVNSAFIVTDVGVLVLDTGPSRRYGEALRQLISEITAQPILAVYNSHHHPDHFLGNQAFADLPIYSLPSTRALISSRGEAYTENMYRLLGDWMRGTDVLPPSHNIELGEHWIGEHQLTFMAFSGHSGDQADLVILDNSTGVLFAFDLVFNERALTTPDTPGLQQWIEDLEHLGQLSFQYLVPGHGVVTSDATPIDQTLSYLRWLDALLDTSSRQGLSAIDVMLQPIPEEFAEVTLTRSELQRSVVHLYPAYEARFLVE
ncbi:beta-lactamase [Nitrincola sp. A-D6]|uniref:quinoprotein relay system zinc metallohydrolase 1 n=1 Tax=Nitrincola sp. A-D6 TaxID=1545442 RepID=UPI00051FAD80|nr:quinoprotein relay system zinc metallohydrolase 1 [Nitrincola sp. A-D6]KGK41617.1 beta-lactamase [Nitrincola sp. A-D6]